MNSVIIRFVELYFAILANTVSGWKCEEYPVRDGVMNPPFNFAFLSNSEFNTLVQLKNVSPKITAIKVAVETDDPASRNTYDWVRHDRDHFRLCGELSYNKVTIGLELYSSNGLCATKVVSEGRHARILQHGLADSIYKSGYFCLSLPSTCAVEMDLRNDCIENKTDQNAKRGKTFFSPNLTHHYSNTTRNTLDTPTPTISDSPKASQNISHTTRNSSITPKPAISDTPKATQNISDTKRNTSITPKPAISDTPKATQNISHTTRNTSITPKPAISDTPKATQNISDTKRNTSITPKPTIYNTPKATQNVSNNSKSTRNISNTSNATWVAWDIADTFYTTLDLSVTSTTTRYTSDTPTTIQNMSDTPNATVIGRNDAVIKKYTIAVASTIFGMALILLVIIAIWKRWCIKRKPSDTPDLLSNDQSSPFYLNLLFRRECNQEIELIEQHQYEEINPQ